MITNPICQLCGGKCCVGCRSHNVKIGCILPYNDRPPYCQKFPFIEQDDGSVALSMGCEHWRIFGEQYERVGMK